MAAKKTTERQAIIRAMKTPPPGGFYVWDGKDEDGRPVTAEELQAGLQDADATRQNDVADRLAQSPRNRWRYALTAMCWPHCAPPGRVGRRG